MEVYLVLNEGTLVQAFFDREEATGYADERDHEGTLEEIEESGRDAEDLTPEEFAEFSFMNGFNGGHHYVMAVEIPELEAPEDEDGEYTLGETAHYSITLADDTEVNTADILELLNQNCEESFF